MRQKSKASGVKKAAAAGAALLAVSTAGAYWKSKMPVPAYTALRVIDGDTFETTEKQLIRLAEVDAPELGLCGGDEAKEELEKLILDKPLYLKVMYRDNYMRLVSYVYSTQEFVNKKMVETGNAIYRIDWKESDQTQELSAAQATAKKIIREYIASNVPS